MSIFVVLARYPSDFAEEQCHRLVCVCLSLDSIENNVTKREDFDLLYSVFKVKLDTELNVVFDPYFDTKNKEEVVKDATYEELIDLCDPINKMTKEEKKALFLRLRSSETFSEPLSPAYPPPQSRSPISPAYGGM